MTRPTLHIALPTTPPSVNHYWQAKGNTRYISAAGKAFRAALIPIAQEAADCLGWKPSKTMRLGVRIHLQFADQRKRDLDNTLKSLFDALASALEFDDSQIDEIHLSRLPVVPKTGATRVWLWEVEPIRIVCNDLQAAAQIIAKGFNDV